MPPLFRFLWPFAFLGALLASGYVAARASHGAEYVADRSFVGPEFWQGKSRFGAGLAHPSIPAQLPGPLDQPWAGPGIKEIAIALPEGAPFDVTVELLDTHEASPPTIIALVDGRETARLVAPAGRGAQPALWPENAPESLTFPIMQSGARELALRAETGSWAGIRRIVIDPRISPALMAAAAFFWMMTVVPFVIRPGAALTAAGAFARRCDGYLPPGAGALAALVIIMAGFAAVREQVIPFHAQGEERYQLFSGDEPVYMLTAYSLALDHDMNVHNNVVDRTYLAFMGEFVSSYNMGTLAFFQTVSPAMKKVDPERWKDRRLMIHRPGVSVLAAPAAFSAQRPRWWTYFIISTFCAAMIAAIVYIALRDGQSATVVLALASAWAFTPPGLFYANQLFPELPMAAVLALGMVLLLFGRANTSVALAAAVAIMAPWFSDRVILPAAAIALGALWRARGARAKSLVLLILASGGALLAAYYYQRFGVPYPIHHAPRETHFMSLANLPSGIVRVLLDSNRGALWLVPALALLPAAYAAWWRSGKRRDVMVINLAALLASLLTVAAYSDWQGGGCPVGRYTVTFQWLAIPALLVWAGAGMSRAQSFSLAALALAGVMETIMLAPRPSAWWVKYYHPLFTYDSLFPYATWVPRLFEITGGEIIKTLVWGALFAAVAGLAVAGVWRGGRRTENRA